MLVAFNQEYTLSAGCASLCLGNKFISYYTVERDLGVYISENFSFNDHCEKSMRKTKQQFGILRRTYMSLCT